MEPEREDLSASTFYRSCAVIALFVVLQLILPQKSVAQWQWNGTPVVPPEMSEEVATDLVADQEDGCWVALTTYLTLFQTKVVVQHFDADGYKSFPDEGIATTDSTELFLSELIGIVPDETGDGVVVFFRCLGDPLPGGMSVYAQRFNPAGERLWGPTGVPVIRFNEFQIGEVGLRSCTTDDAGGGWVLSERRDFPDLYLQGVNADGTLKLPTPRNIGPGEMRGCAIERDGEGGCYAAWREDHYPEQGYTTYYQRFNTEGVPLLDQPGIIAEQYPLNSHLAFDPRIGAYWQSEQSISQGASMNRIRPDGSLLLTQRHFVRYRADMKTSNPVVMGNGDIVWYASGRLRNGIHHLVRIDSTGAPYFDTDTTTIESETNDYPIYRFNNVLTNNDRDHLLIFSQFGHTLPSNTVNSRIGVQNVDESGTDIWNVRTLYDYDSTGTVNGRKARSVLSSDGNYYLSVTIEDYINNLRKIHLFKVFSNGLVAGRDTLDTSVDEDTQISSPGRFTLVDIYPNPFNSGATIKYRIDSGEAVHWKIVSVLGRMVGEGVDKGSPGLRRVYWEPDRLAAGVYFLILRSSKGEIVTRKLVHLP